LIRKNLLKTKAVKYLPNDWLNSRRLNSYKRKNTTYVKSHSLQVCIAKQSRNMHYPKLCLLSSKPISWIVMLIKLPKIGKQIITPKRPFGKS